ncbi:MAG: GAF domain-containing protein, partial [Anaerolineales bacterium]|nr:GAF domain-containing protein [Anaerolineales bacterium]
MKKPLLQEVQSGVLHFGGVRMALVDIEAGFGGLRRQMEVLVGRQLTDTSMQQAGANGGASFARVFALTLTAETTDETAAVLAFRHCVAAYQAAGFGQFEVQVVEWPLGRVLVHGHETFEAWISQQHNQTAESPVCAYTAGVLVGFINVLTNRRDIVCIQHTCQAQGADACLFELLPATEAYRTAVVPFDPSSGFTQSPQALTAAPVVADELATLLDISQNIASTLELEPLLKRILERFEAIVSYDRATIWISEGAELQLLAQHGRLAYPEYSDAPLVRQPLALYRQVMADRKALIIPDVSDASPLAHAFQKEMMAQQSSQPSHSICSWMGIPLITRDNVIGLLVLESGRPDAYTGRHSVLGITIASKVAVAIENARLYQQEQERRQELQTLLDVAAATSSSLALDEMLETTLDR